MHSKKTTNSLTKRFIESAGILFSLLLVIVAIAYAATFTTWAPGEAPQTAPGLGNAELTSGAVDTNTNAITECPDDQFLDGDGSCLTAAEIVAAAGSPPAPGDMYNCEELQKIGSDPDYPIDDDYRLTMDVDCSMTNPNSGNFDPSGTWSDGKGFDPIQLNAGTFDGQGYAIMDLFIDRPGENSVGLFASVGSSSEVKNVGLENVEITGNTNTGGLAGNMSGSSISDSYATGDIAGGINTGGLLGASQSSASISNSYATGDVTGGSNSNTGGLLGLNQRSSISNSYATGDVTGGLNTGGLVGANQYSSVNNSYATGAEGLSGINQFSSINHSYKLTTSQMKDKNSFTPEWDFTDTWQIDEGNSYPCFKYMGSASSSCPRP